MKLLEEIITTDLKWTENTEYKEILHQNVAHQKAQTGWFQYQCPAGHLYQTFEKRGSICISSLAFLTHTKNTTAIERVQTSAFAVILSLSYENYDRACNFLSMNKLSNMRETLALKFSTKTSKHPIHKHWFVENLSETMTRSIPSKYKPIHWRTRKLLKSATPFLTNLLYNNNKSEL